MQLSDEDGRFESHSLLARAITQIPQDGLPVLRRAEEEAVVVGPGEGLHLAGVALEFAGDAIGFEVEDCDGAVEAAGREVVVAV